MHAKHHHRPPPSPPLFYLWWPSSSTDYSVVVSSVCAHLLHVYVLPPLLGWLCLCFAAAAIGVS